MAQNEDIVGDDLPKKNPWQEDRLDYAPFAQKLATSIKALVAQNGYVIGLQGEWGSGKSTALNFVRAFLEKHNEEAADGTSRLTVVDFQPWIVSGHQDLIAAFFKVLSETLREPDGWRKRQWRRIARFLRIGTEPLVDAVAKVAVTVDPSAGIASGAVATVTKKSVGALVDKFLQEPSLQAAYEELRVRLAKSPTRLLVTIDDLDRLEAAEIRSIMQMVKTVGRLPNVIYLLAYDRRIVWDALDKDNSRGARFSEKIVQQEIDLPLPSKEALLSILDEETPFLRDTLDTARWHYIVRDGVRRWICRPRDVLRLANALKFSWSAIQGEIDPQDLLAMEGFRIFDPIAFEWIRSNRDFLFSEGRFLFAGDDAVRSAADELIQRLSTNSPQEVLRLLSVLFPQHAAVFERDKGGPVEPYQQVKKRRGIGCDAGYDTYFSLQPSSNAIPKSAIDGIISAEDKNSIIRLIEPYIDRTSRAGRPMIGSMLEEVRIRYQGGDHAIPTQSLLDAFFELGERIANVEFRPELFSISPRVQLLLTIDEMLQIWGLPNAGQRLRLAFDGSKSLTVCADVFVARARELRQIAGEHQEQLLIGIDDLKSLGKMLLPRIENAVANRTILDAPRYMNVARAWGYLAGSGKAKAWLAASIDRSPVFLAKLALELLTYSLSPRDRSYSLDDAPDRDLFDLEQLKQACLRHLSVSSLDEDHRRRFKAIVDGVERLAAKDAADSKNSSG